MKLSAIQNTVQAVADAISEAVEIETEIVGEDQIIVAGTGRYRDRVGGIEECGDADTNEIYGMIFRTGTHYIVEDAVTHPDYWGDEGELAEICCPIELDGKVIGIIGLVAFTEEQRDNLLSKKASYLNFCSKMAYLIAIKAKEMAITNGMRTLLSVISRGVLYVSRHGTVLDCNEGALKLLGRSYEEVVDKNIEILFDDPCLSDAVKNGEEHSGVEKRYSSRNGKDMHILLDVYPIFLDLAEGSSQSDPGSDAVGAVISLEDMADIKKMVYDMTDNNVAEQYNEIIGNSRSIRDIKAQINRITDSKSSVLITGESGTGKGLVAKTIHYEGSRKDKPFIHINCAAIPDTLIESELFGYEEGAFTGARKSGKPGKFELADGGTIFLDEIGDMPLHLQGKLLHVLQSGCFERVGGTEEISVDVRIIAATNRDFDEMIRNKEFREDLYFRLNVIPINMPALRERREDLPLLLNNALKKYCSMMGKDIRGFSEEAMNALIAYNWPGNVRELENAVEYAINMEDGPVISKDSLSDKLKRMNSIYHQGLTLEEQTRAFEKHIIEQHLEREGYTVTDKKRVARMLGIGEATLYRKMKSLNINTKGQMPY